MFLLDKKIYNIIEIQKPTYSFFHFAYFESFYSPNILCETKKPHGFLYSKNMANLEAFDYF